MQQSQQSTQWVYLQLKPEMPGTRPEKSSCKVRLVASVARNDCSYVHSVSDTTNRENLREIEKCIFVVCLDEPSSHLDSSQYLSEAQDSVPFSNCFHGNGTHVNTCNRWFDHAMQVYITCNNIFAWSYTVVIVLSSLLWVRMAHLVLY